MSVRGKPAGARPTVNRGPIPVSAERLPHSALTSVTGTMAGSCCARAEGTASSSAKAASRMLDVEWRMGIVVTGWKCGSS